MGLLVHLPDDQDAHEAHHHEEHGDDEEPGEQFRVDRGPDPSDEFNGGFDQRWKPLGISFGRRQLIGRQPSQLLLSHLALSFLAIRVPGSVPALIGRPPREALDPRTTPPGPKPQRKFWTALPGTSSQK